ncbi:hypothetical protein ScPMuIL_018255 [Solemya velum]
MSTATSNTKPNKKQFDIILEGVVMICEKCNHREMLEDVMRYAREVLVKLTDMKPCGKTWIRLTCSLLKSDSSYIRGQA